MPIIRTTSGKTLNTAILPDYLEPLFCSHCGQRVSWVDAGNSGPECVLAVCDDCASELPDDEDYSEENTNE
jgi:hypothetical protein